MASCSRESVRNALRRKLLDNDLVSSSSAIYEVKKIIRKKYPSLDVSMDSIESSSNQLSQLLSVSRSIKSYSKSVGPLDSVRLVIDCELHYIVYIFCEIYAEGNLSSPKDIESLEVLARVSNDSWIACHGVENYSSYNVISKDIVGMTLPPDSVRHVNCSRFFIADKTKKSNVCQSCLSLKYYLTSRKKTLSALSTPDRKRRQDVSSTVPFDYLSPFSKSQRMKNMRNKITSLSRKLVSISQHSMELRDEQNEEMAQLVQGISESDVGVQELEKIYQEADATVNGRGEALKRIWDEDVEMFFSDQKKNG